jgi:hypothetical protein
MTVRNLLRYFDGFARSEQPGNEKENTFEISSLCVCMYVLCMHVRTYVLWHVDPLLGNDQETNN